MYFFLSLGNHIYFIIVSDFFLPFLLMCNFLLHTRLYAIRKKRRFDKISLLCLWTLSTHRYNIHKLREFFFWEFNSSFVHFDSFAFAKNCSLSFFAMFHMCFVFSCRTMPAIFNAIIKFVVSSYSTEFHCWCVHAFPFPSLFNYSNQYFSLHKRQIQ